MWTTKNRQAVLTKAVKQQLIAHIKQNALDKEIFIDSINGDKEHLHVLVSLGARQSVADIIQLLKGESSFWINSEKLVKGKFSWQKEYFAVSVSESVLSAVRKYIQNQEEHHRKKSFLEEYDEFMRVYGFHE